MLGTQGGRRKLDFLVTAVRATVSIRNTHSRPYFFPILMKRLALGLSAVSLMLLAACGGSNLTAQQVLDKMHERIVARVTEQTEKYANPLKSETSTDVTVETQPIANIFPGSLNAKLKAKQAADLTDAKKIKFDASADLDLTASAPAEMFGLPGQAMQQASAALVANVRSVNAKMFVNIAEVVVKQPGKSEVKLDAKVASAWYMATFEEINELLAENSEDGTPAITVEQILERSVSQYSNSAADIQDLTKKVRFWNAMELLPEEKGMLRVRVETDKQKLAASLEAIMDYIVKQNDPAGVNAEMTAQMEQAKADMRADIEKMGSLNGVVWIDKDTFDPRGFVGQLAETDGTVTMDIDMLMEKNGDAHVTLKNPADPSENLDFQKKGDAFTLVAEGEKVAEGTITAKKFTMTVYNQPALMGEGMEMDPEMAPPAGTPPPTLLSMDFDIQKATEDALEMTGKIMIPAGASEITVDKFSLVFGNSYKNMKLDMAVRATFLGSPAVSMKVVSERKEVSDVKVDEPSVAKPFEAMMEDFTPLIEAVSQ